jgi:putative heme iron utilization protein
MYLHASNFNPHFNTKLQDAYLHATIQQIDHLANEDVEMQVNEFKVGYDSLIHTRVQAPLSNYANFVVIDTNILLHHLEVLQQIVEDIESLSIPTIIVVPGIVIHELDR